MNAQKLTEPTILLRPPQTGDAETLFPFIYQTQVIETLVWDGPESRSEYRKGLQVRREATLQGREHYFVIVESATDQPIGTASLRPEPAGYTADIGLWIGEPFQGKGYGTQVIGQLIGFGFGVLNLEKIEGSVFVGNWGSRRIFEKNGFQLEGTIRIAVKKRGVGVDEWLFGILREEYLSAAPNDIARPAGLDDQTGPPSPEPT